MSCIPALLSLKGDKEYLPITKDRGGIGVIFLEDGDNYKGYDYCITFNGMLGFRCGYVAISSEHPLYNNTLDDMEGILNVHGGVTFFDVPRRLIEVLETTFFSDKWIGFDAAHAGDAFDKELLNKLCPEKAKILQYIENKVKVNERMPGELLNYRNLWSETIKTREYMVEECKQLIDQLSN